MYDLIYCDLISDNSDISKLQSMCDELLSYGVECIKVISSNKYLCCSDKPLLQEYESILTYDCRSFTANETDSMLEALQRSLYNKEYKIFNFNNVDVIVTPALGRSYDNLNKLDSYYYTMCLVRLLSDFSVNEPFTGLMEDYNTIMKGSYNEEV